MKNKFDLGIKIFADGADLEEMKWVYENGLVDGFTTNPYFLMLAGVTDYEKFASQVLEAIPNLPISFEVISDDLESMEKEARVVSSWGENVYVKIPVTNSQGESSAELIRKLSAEGMKLNITAIYTPDQVKTVIMALSPDTPSVVSVFAGRIGETGVDPMPIVKQAAEMIRDQPLLHTELLWASTREVYNVFQARECGCHIITMAQDILHKLSSIGTPLDQVSKDTVKYFYDCAVKSGFKIIP